VTESVVQVTDLVKRYGELEAVRGINFEVQPGETFGFLGPNGAGKSTTIKILCTLRDRRESVVTGSTATPPSTRAW
jgi:ABC-2 type transport system ATP-binding protein